MHVASQVSRTGIGWGFLACGWAATGVALLAQDPMTGGGVGALGAALWCMILALAEWQPPTGGGE